MQKVLSVLPHCSARWRRYRCTNRISFRVLPRAIAPASPTRLLPSPQPEQRCQRCSRRKYGQLRDSLSHCGPRGGRWWQAGCAVGAASASTDGALAVGSAEAADGLAVLEGQVAASSAAAVGWAVQRQHRETARPPATAVQHVPALS